jgi:DNA modification methylase
MTNITWTNERRKLKDLKPWERNPRQITKDQAKRLVESFNEFGQVETIAIGPNNEVYNGHQRLNVLKDKYGDEYEVEVRVSSQELTEKQREKLTVYLHKGAAGVWDFDTLANEWELDDLLEWGFDKGELDLDLWAGEPPDDVEPQIDKAEELREKWGVESGQLWKLGEHRIICGDCTDKAVVERVMQGEQVSLIVTDPPYGVNYDGGANNETKREKLTGDLDAELYDKFLQVAPINNECALYMWHAGRRANEVYEAAIKNGFEIRSQIIWHKLKAHYGAWMAQYKQKHEPCIYCVKGAPTFCGATNEVTVWEYEQPSRNEFHPTQKPIELMERAIGNHPYLIIYEPFNGSGTTLIACERLGRKCRAVEISPAYVAVAIQRWVDVTGGTPELVEPVIQR